MTSLPLLTYGVHLHPAPFAELVKTWQHNRPWVQVLRVPKRRPRYDVWLSGPQNTPFLFFLN